MSAIETLAALDYHDCKSLFLHNSIFKYLSNVLEGGRFHFERNKWNISRVTVLLTVLLLYHWYYLLLSSLFRMTVGNGKVPHHYPSFFAAFIRHFYLDCNFIMLYGAYLNQQAWINPLIADFYSLNKINILFVKFCSYVKIVRYSYKIYPTKNEYILAKKVLRYFFFI